MASEHTCTLCGREIKKEPRRLCVDAHYPASQTNEFRYVLMLDYPVCVDCAIDDTAGRKLSLAIKRAIENEGNK